MKMIRSVLLLSLLFAGLQGQAHSVEPVTLPAPEVVRIWPSAAPRTSDWKIKEINVPFKDKNGKAARIVTNVTDPTLTVIRPAAGKANGTAVIVCPGGGFQILAWDLEGLEVGQWLADRGITAFVLKYRVRPNMTLPNPGAGAPRPKGADFEKTTKALAPYRHIAMADGLQAVRFVRENAPRYSVAPDKIGIMGFSAGAMTTMAVVLEGRGPTHPDFAASIYGGMENKAPGADAPPLFVAAAQDDNRHQERRPLPKMV